ncbi:hypothetical protein [Nocardia flavorosea]|uniref:Uncharacterized protein n=1 Tax=Nocardia flavorosea TaxID=53429 RepID=A0A846YP74_9NOCA|nr:hypothetical protein [Nocardia flavorosea]NKY60917.1 hypothetical protein [Nocardia flavorosea]
MTFYELTDREGLPAGTDIAAILADPTISYRTLFAILTTYRYTRLNRETLAKLDAGKVLQDDPERTELARESFRAGIAAHATVTPTQALEANRKLVDYMTGTRWQLMQEAREAGESWTTIGAALDMTKQGALDWYKRKIGEQEKYLPQFHDAERARAVVDE